MSGRNATFVSLPADRQFAFTSSIRLKSISLHLCHPPPNIGNLFASATFLTSLELSFRLDQRTYAMILPIVSQLLHLSLYVGTESAGQPPISDSEARELSDLLSQCTALSSLYLFMASLDTILSMLQSVDSSLAMLETPFLEWNTVAEDNALLERIFKLPCLSRLKRWRLSSQS